MLSKSDKISDFLVPLSRAVRVAKVVPSFSTVGSGITIVCEINKPYYVVLVMGLPNLKDVNSSLNA